MSTVLEDAAYHKELIDGREIEKPLPKNLHAFIQIFLGAALLARLSRSYRAATELNVVCGSDRLVPDVLVAERSARYENGDLADPPVLAVEIMSPGQDLSDLFSKCERLLQERDSAMLGRLARETASLDFYSCLARSRKRKNSPPQSATARLKLAWPKCGLSWTNRSQTAVVSIRY